VAPKSRPAGPIANAVAAVNVVMTPDAAEAASKAAVAAGRVIEAGVRLTVANQAVEAASNRAAHVRTAKRVGAKGRAKIVRGAIADTGTTEPCAMMASNRRGTNENRRERWRTKSASSNFPRLSCKIPGCKPRKAGWSWKKNPPTRISATSKTPRARRVKQRAHLRRVDDDDDAVDAV
jgi:hypothetical protein